MATRFFGGSVLAAFFGLACWITGPSETALSILMVAFVLGMGGLIILLAGRDPETPPQIVWDCGSGTAPGVRTDQEALARIAEYRQRFEKGPVGYWESSHDFHAGVGFDGLGLCFASFEFFPDGTALFRDCEFLEQPVKLAWKSTGPCQIELRLAEPGEDDCDEEDAEWERRHSQIDYDFFMVPGDPHVFLYSAGQAPEPLNLHKDTLWFWRTIGQFVFVREPRDESLSAGEPSTHVSRHARPRCEEKP
jgi:hypothetical protein